MGKKRYKWEETLMNKTQAKLVEIRMSLPERYQRRILYKNSIGSGKLEVDHLEFQKAPAGYTEIIAI